MNNSNTQQSGQITYRTILTVSLLIGLLFFVGHLWDTYASSTAVVSKTTPSIENAPPGVKFTKIQDVQVGERAIGKNPEINNDERQSFLPDPDPATWRKLTLEMIKPDGKRLNITLLRPLSWIEKSGATLGATICLDLEEMGALGNATVAAIDPCPLIKPGKGNVITGTFHHEATNTIDLYVDGVEKPIGTTDNHPFWSVTRCEFVEAGKLLPGEELHLYSGPTAKVVQILPRPGPERVHNIEVMNEHVYFIADLGILVHNVCSVTFEQKTISKSRPTSKQSEAYVEAHIINNNPQLGVKIQQSYFKQDNVPYGTKGSVRPDITLGGTTQIEVKNYNIKNNTSGLINTLNRQLDTRNLNLPPGHTQQVFIDARGQGLTQLEISKLGEKLKSDINHDINITVFW